jgi:condensin complex subunit 2
MRGGGSGVDARASGEIDEQFWAQAAAEQAAGQGDDEIDESKRLVGNVLADKTDCTK